MRMNRFAAWIPDLVAALIAWVVGDLFDWWNWPDVPLEGGIFIVLVVIWVRLAFRGL